MDNVKRYTTAEIRYETQGGRFVRAEDFEAMKTIAYAVQGAGVVELNLQIEQLKAELYAAKEFQPIGEACLANRGELRAMLGLSTPGENLHEVVKALKAGHVELVDAMNEILRVTPLGSEAFGIAALVLGELGVTKESKE
jgi:hypothetical protein